MRFNEESLKRMDGTNYGHPEIRRLELADKDWSTTTEHKSIDSDRSISLSMAEKDLEMPMPPLALAPLQHHNIR